MYKYGWFLMVCLFLMGSAIDAAEPYPDIVDRNIENGCLWFDSLNVRFMGNWPFGNPERSAYDIARELLYFGSGGGVYVFDVSNPANPVVLSEAIHTRGNVRGLTYDQSAQILYIADDIAGIEIWDVATISSPVKLGFCPDLDDAQDVVVVDSFAYVADGYYGFSVVNIADPTNPFEIGTLTLRRRALGIACADSFVYIADEDSGLSIINVANPTNPQEIGHYDTPHRAYDIAISDTFAYIADADSGLRIINVADPSNPVEVGSYDPPSTSYGVYGVALADTFAYITNSYAGLRIVNIADPTNPFETGAYTSTGMTYGITLVDTLAYISEIWQGLRVINVSDPSHPTQTSAYTTPTNAYAVVVCDTLALLSYCEGLFIINITDLSSPYEMGHSYVGYSYDLDAHDTIAYVCAGWAGLGIVDISDPSNPSILSYCNTSNYCQGVGYAHSFAYVADRDSGLRVINVSDPQNPFETGSCLTSDEAYDVVVLDTFAYVADYQGGLRVINVADPSNPVETGFCDTPGYAFGVAVSDTIAYIADLSGGVRIINVADPSNPVEISFFDRYTNGVAVSDSFAYISGGHYGQLRILNVVDPSNPVEVARYISMPNSANKLAVSNHVAFVASSGCGLQIYENLLTSGSEENGSSPHLILSFSQNRPNPFTSKRGTTIEYSIPKTALVRLYIYNTLGQRVKTLVNEVQTTGSHQVIWKGTSDSGKALAPGVYFCKIETSDLSATKKILLVN